MNQKKQEPRLLDGKVDPGVEWLMRMVFVTGLLVALAVTIVPLLMPTVAPLPKKGWIALVPFFCVAWLYVRDLRRRRVASAPRGSDARAPSPPTYDGPCDITQPVVSLDHYKRDLDRSR